MSQASNDNTRYPFPDEFAPPKKKESDAYGLQAARAMYFSTNRYGYRLFNDTSSTRALYELAQGRQSTDNIYRMLGFFNDRGQTQDDQQTLAYIDVQVINLVTKYVNRTVAKLQKYDFDINFTAVDPISINEIKQRNSQIKVLYEMKEFFEKVKVNPQQYFPQLDVSMMPDLPDELMFSMAANYKVKKIVDADKTLKLINNTLNDMPQVMRQFDWYHAVAGRAHLYCYLDENNYPRIKTIDPLFWGGSYVENEDFSAQEYSFFIDFITRNQFKKEAQGHLTKAEMEEVISAHAFPNTAASFGTLPQYYDNYDGLEYIPVMRFFFLSNDNVAYKIWNHSDTGNKMIDMTHYNYFPTEQSTKEQKVVQNSFTSVYGGVWVIDSNTVYNYGRMNMPKTNLVNTKLPIVTFAANMKEGRIVSMVSQLEEPAFMLNVAWNRLKDIIAKGRMGPLELDLTSVENIALGKGGEVWTPRQAIDFFFQSNIWVKRTPTTPYGQALGPSLQEVRAGLTINDYMLVIQQCIRFMDDLTGSNVVEQANIPDRITTGAVNQSVQSSEESIEYLVNGHLQGYKQACHILLLLAQQAKMNKAQIQGMIPALGTSTTEFFEVPDDLPYCEYGLQMVPAPSAEEWQEFYGELLEAMKEGKINASDSAFIRQIKDMTLARYILAVREKVNEAKAQAALQQQQQFQAQTMEHAAQLKLQSEMALKERDRQIEIERMQIQARIDDMLMQRQAMLDASKLNITEQMKQTIAKQQGIDSVLKEALRSKSEDKKSELQHAGKIVGAQAQIAVAAMNKKKETTNNHLNTNTNGRQK